MVAVPFGSRAGLPSFENNGRPSRRIAGRAGRLQTVFSESLAGVQHLEWFFPLDEIPVDDMGGVVRVAMWLMPFLSGDGGPTDVGIDDALFRTFVSVRFENGRVNGGLPYIEGDWNRLEFSVDFGNRRWKIAVNGVESEWVDCGGDSFSVHALRVNYDWRGLQPAVAWIDSVVLSRESEDLLEIGFESRPESAPNLVGGFTSEDPLLPQLTIVRDSSRIILSWSSEEPECLVEVADSPNGPWRAAVSGVRGSDGQWIAEISAVAGTSFYRVRAIGLY